MAKAKKAKMGAGDVDLINQMREILIFIIKYYLVKSSTKQR